MAEIKVVVAEDSNLLRSLLVHQLSQEVDIELAGEARNGREAVDLAARIRPDVIIMDLDMPVMNGIQATERITSQQP
ncbi:MAG: response regulator, partial [Chloroflexi bacterium]|nr:response regulator [Chloroflexota bacterium]